MMAGRVDKGCGEFDLEGFGAFDEIDDGGGGGGDSVEKFVGGLLEFGVGLDQVGVWFGVFDQGGCGADFAGEEVGGFGSG